MFLGVLASKHVCVMFFSPWLSLISEITLRVCWDSNFCLKFFHLIDHYQSHKTEFFFLRLVASIKAAEPREYFILILLHRIDNCGYS